MATLRLPVFVRDPSGNRVRLAAGVPVPPWAETAITNASVWDEPPTVRYEGAEAIHVDSPVGDLVVPMEDVIAMAVPDGDADEIDEWVDGDPERAALAIAAESQRKQPRKRLINRLSKLIAEPEGE